MYPCFSQSFSYENTSGVSCRNITVTNVSNCLTYTVASLFVRTSPLAVITVVGLLYVLMVSNSAELRSFSLTICILALDSTTNSLSLGSFVDAAGSTHSSAGEKNVALSFALSLCIYIFGKIPSLALGTSLLSFRLFVGLILKFYSVLTSLMSRFDQYFSKRWSFLIPDTRVT